MAEQDLFYLAVEPPPSIDASLARDVASVLKKDPSDARLLLAGRIPRILTHFSDADDAESTAKALCHLGLKVMVIENSRLHAPDNLFEADNMEFTPDTIVFRKGSTLSTEVSFKEIVLIISGVVQSRTESTETKQKTKLNLAGTLLMGGIPMFRTEKQKTTGQTVTTEPFIRLYQKEGGSPAVQLFRDDIHSYAFLGREIERSSHGNFQKTVNKIRGLCPGAIFDDRLTRVSAAFNYTGQPLDDMAINTALIHVFQTSA